MLNSTMNNTIITINSSVDWDEEVRQAMNELLKLEELGHLSQTIENSYFSLNNSLSTIDTNEMPNHSKSDELSEGTSYKTRKSSTFSIEDIIRKKYSTQYESSSFHRSEIVNRLEEFESIRKNHQIIAEQDFEKTNKLFIHSVTKENLHRPNACSLRTSTSPNFIPHKSVWQSKIECKTTDATHSGKKDRESRVQSQNIIVLDENAYNEVENQDPEVLLDCTKCPTHFNSYKHLERHFISKHSNFLDKKICVKLMLTPFHCKKYSNCAMQFENKILLKIHVIYKHWGSEISSCPYEECNFKPSSLSRSRRWSSWIEHVRKFHQRSKKFQCGICFKNYYSLRNTVKRHVIRAHLYPDYDRKFASNKSSKASKSENNAILPDNIERIYMAKEFKCKKCYKSFTSEKTLQVHFQSIHLKLHPKCPLCPFERNSENKVIRHLKLVHEKLKPFRCKMCSLMITSLREARSHTCNKHKPKLLTHITTPVNTTVILPENIEKTNISKDFKCHKCCQKFSSSKTLQVHFQCKHLNAPPKCPMCSFERNSINKVIQHLKFVHEKLYPFKCKMCSLMIASLHDAKRHSLQHERKISEKITSLVNNNVILPEHIERVTYRNDFTCEKCLQKFMSQKTLQVHFQCKHLKAPPKCPMCSYQRNAESKVIEHLKFVHEKLKPFRCKICSIMISSLSEANRHSLQHKRKIAKKTTTLVNNDAILPEHIEKVHNTNDFKCEKCFQKFISQKTLQVHFQCKHLRLPSKCPLCPFERKSLSKVIRHLQLSHEKLKPFRCKICSLMIPSLRDAKRHSLQHKPKITTQVKKTISLPKNIEKMQITKDFACMKCQSRFYSRNLLHAHYDMSHLKYTPTCKHCHIKYSSPTNLLQHITAVHENIRLYKCCLCDHKYSALGIVVNHLQKVHYTKRPSISSTDDKTVTSVHKKDTSPLYSSFRSIVTYVLNYYYAYKISLKNWYVELLYSNIRKLKPKNAMNLSKVCQVCKCRFSSENLLIAHKNYAHFKISLKCKNCQGEFKNYNFLKTHIKASHEREKKYICKVCAFKSSTLSCLKFHFQLLHKRQIILQTAHSSLTSLACKTLGNEHLKVNERNKNQVNFYHNQADRFNNQGSTIKKFDQTYFTCVRCHAKFTSSFMLEFCCKPISYSCHWLYDDVEALLNKLPIRITRNAMITKIDNDDVE